MEKIFCANYAVLLVWSSLVNTQYLIFFCVFFFKSFLVIWSNIHHVACRDIYLLSSINLKDVEKQRKIWEKLLFDIEIFMEKVDMFRCLTVRLWWLPLTASAATCKYYESVRTSMKAHGVLFSFFWLFNWPNHLSKAKVSLHFINYCSILLDYLQSDIQKYSRVQRNEITSSTYIFDISQCSHP